MRAAVMGSSFFVDFNGTQASYMRVVAWVSESQDINLAEILVYKQVGMWEKRARGKKQLKCVAEAGEGRRGGETYQAQ